MKNNEKDNIQSHSRNTVLGEVKIKHYLEYCMYSNKVSWCPICNSHFYNERNEKHTTKATEEHYHEL